MHEGLEKYKTVHTNIHSLPQPLTHEVENERQ